MSKYDAFILILLLFILTGCSTRNKKYDSYLHITNSWKGSHINELTNKKGYPHQSYTASNGNKVFVYTYVVSSGNMFKSKPVENPLETIPAQKKTYYCQTFFETDNNGIIVRTSYRGNACK